MNADANGFREAAIRSITKLYGIVSEVDNLLRLPFYKNIEVFELSFTSLVAHVCYIITSTLLNISMPFLSNNTLQWLWWLGLNSDYPTMMMMNNGESLASRLSRVQFRINMQRLMLLTFICNRTSSINAYHSIQDYPRFIGLSAPKSSQPGS
jgi:hypothetical protein